MKFRVQIRTNEGAEESQTIEAATRFAVYTQVEKSGGSVLSVEEIKTGGLSALSSISFGSSEHVKTDSLVTFTKNLAAMLAAGLNLPRALSVIERQSSNKTLKKVVSDLIERIKAGNSFHEALDAHAKVFPKLFIAMTKAGEEGGSLSQTLGIIAKQMERSSALTKKVKGAMIYPSIILLAIFIIAILMLMFVVPTLSSTFASFHTKLPMATQIIINLSNLVSKHAILVIIGTVLVLFGGSVFFRTKLGGQILLFAALHFPGIGELVQETFSARAARTLSSLISSGVDMVLALQITREVVGENVFGKVIAEAEARVQKGDPLSSAFEEHTKLYPVFMGDMISVGEETGKVADMLSQVAEYYEVDVENRTKDLSTIIEPLLMLFIGGFVGVFAVAMIAPIYSLSSAI